MAIREILQLGNPDLYEISSEVEEDDLSELLQHELDHLDGVPAVMRAVDEHSFATRSERWRVKDP